MNLIIMLNALTKLTDKLQGWVTKGIKLVPNLIVAILILVIFFAIGRLVLKIVSRSLHKMTDNKAITGILVKVSGLITLTIGLIIDLSFDIRALTNLTYKLKGWVTKGIKLVPNQIVAILILVIFFAIGRLVLKMVSRSLQKMTDNKAITGLLVKVAGLVTITIGIFFALWAIELSGVVTSLLAGAGVLGLAAGFALQDQAADFFAGILLSIRHPFAIGDIIESNGYYGNVHDINLRATVIKTTQGNLIHLPNSE